MTSPRFMFPRTPDQQAPRELAGPDAWIVMSSAGTYERVEGEAPEPAEDPYETLDRFVNEFDTGIVAGWLGYELAGWNHAVPRPDNDDGVPLLCLAHFTGEQPLSRPRASGVELGSFESTISREEYVRRVETVRDRIREGYVYQVNLSQRFTAPVDGRLLSLLDGASSDQLPPHSVYASVDDTELLSLSPERFLRVEDRKVMTQPIKGTRPRRSSPHEDDRMRETLLRSGKDRAEHAMIVDLERNDLNRVCRPGSVDTTQLIAHERFPTVHHLVSTVRGRLREDVGAGQLFRQTFPGGSITGAPKYTALKIINRLESRQRGLYTGTIGYWDLDRSVADWNIAIRTLVRRNDRAWWDSGGGIVIDSDPNEEYDESLDKVSILRNLRNQQTSSGTPVRGQGRANRGTGPMV